MIVRWMTSLLVVTTLLVGCPADDTPNVVATTTTGTDTTTAGGTTGGDTSTDTTGTDMPDVVMPKDAVMEDDAGTTDGDGTTGGDELFCEPGTAFCNGQNLFKCAVDGSTYQATPCPAGCSNDQCVTDCVAGTKTCLDSKTAGVCQADGSYKTQKCTQGVCKEGLCTTDNKVCTPNKITCIDTQSKLVKCEPDGLSEKTFKTCEYGCDEAKADCNAKVCEPGARQCSFDEPLWIEECATNASGWTKIQGCAFECDKGKCIDPECAVGATICGPEGVMTCAQDQSQYNLTVACQHGCKSNKQGKPVCAFCQVGQLGCDWFQVTQCNDPLEEPTNVETCMTDETCAQGGCISMLIVPEDQDQNQVVAFILKGLTQCFEAGQTGPCKGLNTKAIDYQVSKDMMKDLVCEKPEAAVFFDSEDQYNKALDLLGCTELFDLDDLEMKTGPIQPDLDGIECYSFGGGGLNGKQVTVTNCEEL